MRSMPMWEFLLWLSAGALGVYCTAQAVQTHSPWSAFLGGWLLTQFILQLHAAKLQASYQPLRRRDARTGSETNGGYNQWRSAGTVKK